MEEVKRRKVFRNASTVRIFYLKPREAGGPEFRLEPGMTVEAMDDAEEKILGCNFDLRDVEKDTPALSSSLDKLQAQLAAEQAKNAELIATNKALKDESAKTTRRNDARSSKR